ncbi:carotenoid oxygenase family protein [Phenylobacterium sp.]|uniref:carotenoid oxygenase family protein n=1 Tax=Phenylobacterium sp. TaxID=1871053 RepID=UPI0025EC0CE5|nr:carotenoid oxygenase family protein [Phenylobacterium sp.]
MTSPAPRNPYLAKGFAPVRDEVDIAALDVEGRFPDDLAGTLYRIGPNPQFDPRPPYNPLMGDGMVHAFTIRDGRVAYRNRWVRTGRWRRENTAGRALFATAGLPSDDDPDAGPRPADGVANTNLVWHAGRLLALEEGSPPLELDPETLATRGLWTFGGRLARNMTAHPRVDPASGAMALFANIPRGRLTGEIALYEADAAGALSEPRIVQGPYPALIHDFAITERVVVVVVCPTTLSLERAAAGGPLIAWEPGRGAAVIVAPRAGGEVRRYPAPPRMAWHIMNAFEDGDRIVIDLCEQDAAMFSGPDGRPPEASRAAQRLARWEVAAGEVRSRRLHDLICEYPRIDERRTGRRYRYGWLACLGGPGTDDLFHRGLARFDHETGEMAVWSAGPRHAVSEPVFVARGPAEGEGWIVCTVYDEGEDTSCLAVLDAEDVAAGPVARARFGRRVPMGFHGLWRPLSGR